MRKAVEGGEIRFVTERFEKTYLNWVENLRDWCISRQIWFGHRIPVWYKNKETRVSIESPGTGWEQDPDVLDTWFSSGLWTFSTLGWPDKTDDLKHFHPTNIIETGYDIIPLWVSRMVLMSGFHLGQVPFRTVYIHGLVRDEQGRKISKSLGNNIDPVDMGEKYGTDALRLSLVMGTAPGTDSKISESKIRGYKHFANKLWNISRFVLENTEGVDIEKKPELSEENRQEKKYVDELNGVVAEVTKNLEEYRLDLAADNIYHYVWDRFAAEILEKSKPILSGADKDAAAARIHTLYSILDTSLRLLHPFMPFVTEEIWSHVPALSGVEGPKKETDLLMVAEWPV